MGTGSTGKIFTVGPTDWPNFRPDEVAAQVADCRDWPAALEWWHAHAARLRERLRRCGLPRHRLDGEIAAYSDACRPAVRAALALRRQRG